VTVFAGDDAIYSPARGKPELVRVYGRTPKRVAIIIARTRESGTDYLVRYVKAERLESRGGGLLDAADDRR
jgi:hypothetical protein